MNAGKIPASMHPWPPKNRLFHSICYTWVMWYMCCFFLSQVDDQVEASPAPRGSPDLPIPALHPYIYLLYLVGFNYILSLITEPRSQPQPVIHDSITHVINLHCSQLVPYCSVGSPKVNSIAFYFFFFFLDISYVHIKYLVNDIQ